MKTTLLFLISLFYFTNFPFVSLAQVPSDAINLLADNSIGSKALFLVKPANVVYPSSLETHREQSSDYVQKFSEKKRDYLIRIYNLGKKYFPKVTTILNQYDLPEELKVLLALESEFKGNIVSKAGAVGYWQMMSAAAREYGLRIAGSKDASANLKVRDDRKNLSKSTSAAAKYLRDCCKAFNNDLLLAVAAYNCGGGNVRKAVRKSGIENPDFWDIKKYLPTQTRNYVMNFIALSVIFGNFENFSKNELMFTAEYYPNSDNNIVPLKTD